MIEVRIEVEVRRHSVGSVEVQDRGWWLEVGWKMDVRVGGSWK